MSFDFLKNFIVEEGAKSGLQHSFYRVSNEEVQEIDSSFKIPIELKDFYNQIGFGFMFNTDESYSINKFLDPKAFKKINLREDYYEFDPTLDLFTDPEYLDKLIFFEVNEGVYLLISKQDINGKNAIYYFDQKIADSLEEFLIKFDREGHYFEENESQS